MTDSTSNADVTRDEFDADAWAAEVVDDIFASTALAALGYSFVRRLPTGEWAGLQRMMFTTELVVGITRTGWRTRFCFERWSDAREALMVWDGCGWPPGYWIKQKPEETPGPAMKGKRDAVDTE